MNMLTENGFYSYLVGATAYLALLVFLVVAWWNRPMSRYLWLATLMMLISCLTSTIYSLSGFPPFFVTQVLDTLTLLAWFLVIPRLTARPNSPVPKYLPNRWHYLPLIAVIGTLGLLIVPPLLFIYSGIALHVISAIHLGFLLLSIIGMVYVEQLFRNASRSSRWNLKFFALGIGGLFAYDFFIYSHAILSGEITPVYWEARGAVRAVITPLVALAALRSRKWAPDMQLSRRLAFQSSVLVIAGIYLIAVSFAGYYVQAFGGSVGDLLQVVFVCAAIVLLVATITSNNFRTRLKVVVSRHLFMYRYDYRDEWIRMTRTLSSERRKEQPEPVTQRAIRAVAETVNSSNGAIWLLDDNQQLIPQDKLNVGWERLQPIATDSHFIRLVNNDEWIINLREYKELHWGISDLDIPEWLVYLPDAWLLIPLKLHDELLGIIVIHQPNITIELNWEDFDLLKIVARQCASYLAQKITSDALLKAKQFEALNQMSAFVVHDLKTLNSQLSLLVRNAEKHRNNPQFIDDMISTTEHSVKKMDRLIHQLKHGDRGEEKKQTSIDNLLSKLVKHHGRQQPKPTLVNDVDDLFINADEEQLSSVIGHIIQNAQDATAKDGFVTVTLSQETLPDAAIILIEDNGTGMDSQFIQERLFSPFESTKGVSGMGIGVYQCREYLKKINGHIGVESTQGKGTTFRLTIPASPKQ